MTEEDRESPRLWRETTAGPVRVMELLDEIGSLQQRSHQLIEEHYRVLEALERVFKELARIAQNNQRTN